VKKKSEKNDWQLKYDFFILRVLIDRYLCISKHEKITYLSQKIHLSFIGFQYKLVEFKENKFKYIGSFSMLVIIRNSKNSTELDKNIKISVKEVNFSHFWVDNLLHLEWFLFWYLGGPLQSRFKIKTLFSSWRSQKDSNLIYIIIERTRIH
jgi:hypothetical protein